MANPPGRLPSPALTIRHATGEYPVYIGRGLLTCLADFTRAHLPGRRVAIISDDRVARLIPLSLDAPRFTFPAGEAAKTRETWIRLTDELLRHGYGRDSAVVAVGGGVTADLAGFVSATYHRGIPVLQVPTTLLAMLDASVGGKTGVDTPEGKNLVGAFHQPVGVILDPSALTTLDVREVRAGLAEAVKHAAVADAAQLGWLEAQADTLLEGDAVAVERLLRHSLPIKAEIVEQDETESGRRAILNAGHTVAHALEKVTGYRLHHGEAVAIGLVAEATIGEQMGLTAAGTARALETVLRRLGLPTRIPPSAGTDDLLEAMRADKKNRRGEIRLALLARVGTAKGAGGEWTTPVGEAAAREGLEHCREP